jgi:hypothetical protein
MPHGQYFDTIERRPHAIERDVALTRSGDGQLADRTAHGPSHLRVAFEHHDRVDGESDRQRGIVGVLLRQKREQPSEIVQRPRRVEDPRKLNAARDQRRVRARRTGVGRRTVRPCARPTMYAWTSSTA